MKVLCLDRLVCKIFGHLPPRIGGDEFFGYDTCDRCLRVFSFWTWDEESGTPRCFHEATWGACGEGCVIPNVRRPIRLTPVP